MGDPKDRIEEEEGLLPAESRLLNVFAHVMCEDHRCAKRREKIVSDPREKKLEESCGKGGEPKKVSDVLGPQTQVDAFF